MADLRVATSDDQPPSRLLAHEQREASELVHLRRIARAASAHLNAPYLNEHRERLAELLFIWRVDHKGS